MANIRFKEVDVQKLIDGNENKTTLVKTLGNMKLLGEIMAAKYNDRLLIHCIPAIELDECRGV